MKAIKIIKPNQSKNETPAAEKKPIEPAPNHLVHTIKGWIAETRERKRREYRSFAALSVLILIAFAVTMGQSLAQQSKDRPLTPEERAIKVSIATTAGFLGQPTKRYKVGEQIPVSITMTNTSTTPVSTCISGDLYQDVPKLTRDGKLIPYMKDQSWEVLYAKQNQVCQLENLPEPVLLRPNEPTVADWLVLVDNTPSGQADVWYDTLPAGKYELTIQRRLACCDGPMVESNKIDFEVVP
ncbi:MAG TPA: hypothetical protein VFM63_05365 [Pyrinomonadaceae bacterium]|nr:hypothetical protein [Pyrinomonadaceae bacterium]